MKTYSTEIGGLIHSTWLDGEAVQVSTCEIKSDRGSLKFYIFWAGFSEEEAKREFDGFIENFKKLPRE